MIEVMIKSNQIKIQGHAKYAEFGKDIVCSGVSTLLQTLITSMEHLTTDKIKYEISPGMADIHFRDLSEQGKTLIGSFFIGVSMISNEYPNHVRIV